MSQEKQGIFEFGDFQLDIGKGVLLRRGQPVSLQWKTFELLCVLIKSNGNLIATGELMDKLWADTFVEENNLRQHISALRKALGEGENGIKFIETVPRRGYRFLPEVRVIDSVKRAVSTAAPENLAAQFSTSALPPNTLSRQTTLIGREKEIAEIKNLLRREDVRILTLTGVGGTGKTTLAQAVASEITAEFNDGVFFIELAAVTNPELVASTIGQTLGVKESGGKTNLEVLENYLSDKQILLVVDNFEQILPAAPVLTKLLASSPYLKILATSRARLQLASDREFVVPPLAVPENSTQISFDELSKNESVRLFVERAQAVRSSFELTNENSQSVAEICRRLDGLPLAIELAAARVKIISPQSILERLVNRLKLLTGGAKDLPTRQQTVRETVEWSYELLAEDKKILFRRLAVFAGGFTVETAESVLTDYEPQITGYESGRNKRQTEYSTEILDGIAYLNDKSLLISKVQADGEIRFRMLEVIREYALEVLETSGEAEAIRRSHAEYFLKLGEEAEPHLQSAEAIKWLNRLEEEQNNLRFALEWSLEYEAETAARLAGAIRHFWSSHTHLTEGRKWLKAALEQNNDSPSLVRFKLLNGLALLAQDQGDYLAARKAHEECLFISRAIGNKQKETVTCLGLGMVAYKQEDFTSARKFYEEGLATALELNDKYAIAGAFGSLGQVEYLEGNSATARPLYEQSLLISRDIGNKQYVIANLVNLGMVEYAEGDYKAAGSHFAEAMAIAQELGDKSYIANSLDGFAALALRNGESKLAGLLSGAAESLCKLIGYEIGPIDRRFRDLYLTELRAALSEADFAKFYEQGRKLKLEEAIKLALETVPETSFPQPFAVIQSTSIHQVSENGHSAESVSFVAPETFIETKSDNGIVGDDETLMESANKQKLDNPPETVTRRQGLRRGLKFSLWGIGVGFGCFVLLKALEILSVMLYQYQSTLPPETPKGLTEMIGGFLNLLVIPAGAGYFSGIGLFVFGIARMIYALFVNESSKLRTSQIERWITIVLMSVIAAVSIPNLIASYRAANEFRQKQNSTTDLPVNNKSPQFLNFSSVKYQKVIENQHGRVAISPDGRFLVYTDMVGGKQTLWVRQLSASTNIQILPATEIDYRQLKFSNDSEYIYFNHKNSLYRVSVLGGEAVLILKEVEIFSLSPNDKEFVFIRHLPDYQCGLFIAGTDGTAERIISRRESPCYNTVEWSPDGTLIAFSVGQSDTGDANTQLFAYKIADGSEMPLSEERWYRIHSVVWLPDLSGIILSGRKKLSDENPLWQISYPGGETRQLTDGLVRYAHLSLTEKGDQLLTSQSVLDSYLSIAPADAPSDFRKLGSAFYGMTWLPDGKIVYSSRVNKNSLWTINTDGTEHKQLTFDEADYLNPVASSDGRYIFYTSTDGGVNHIWRMNADGTGKIQLTNGSGEQKPNVSSDGQWLFYQVHEKSPTTIWKVSTGGGEPVQITKDQGTNPSVSPDAKLLAYLHRKKSNNDTLEIRVMSLENGQIVKEFALPEGSFIATHKILWTRDGQALIYTREKLDRIANIWRQPLDGSAPTQITNYNSERIFDFSWSPDGKQLAVIRGSWKNEAVLISGFR